MGLVWLFAAVWCSFSAPFCPAGLLFCCFCSSCPKSKLFHYFVLLNQSFSIILSCCQHYFATFPLFSPAGSIIFKHSSIIFKHSRESDCLNCFMSVLFGCFVLSFSVLFSLVAAFSSPSLLHVKHSFSPSLHPLEAFLPSSIKPNTTSFQCISFLPVSLECLDFRN